MKPWIRYACLLYPRAWRDRYRVEFEALLEDFPGGWRDLVDVVLAAIRLQWSSLVAWLRFGLAGSLASAVLASALLSGTPPRYVSETVIWLAPGTSPSRTAAQFQFGMLQQEVLSRTRLEEIIVNFNLYPAQRKLTPRADLIHQMRARDLDVRLLLDDGSPPAVHISFTYPDPVKARAVVTRLVADFFRDARYRNSVRAMIWEIEWGQPAPSLGNLELVRQPSLPRLPDRRGMLRLAAAAVLAGFLAGAVIPAVRRRRYSAVRAAGCGLAGLLVATAGSFLIPSRYTATAFLALAPPEAPPLFSGDAATRLAMRLPSFRQDSINAMTTVSELGIPGVRLRFADADPDRAYAGIRQQIISLSERNRQLDSAELPDLARRRLGAELALLEPPVVPHQPDGPSRPGIALSGAAAGLLLGTLRRTKAGVNLPRRELVGPGPR